MSLISIIVPVYNTEMYLKKCLESIVNQTYSNLEIILINDGSTDNSLDICNEYKNKDGRIIVIDKKNCGVSSARNTGLDTFTGEYVTFIDSDDWVDKNYIYILHKYIIDYGVDFSSANNTRISDSDEVLNSKNTQNEIIELNKSEAIDAFFNSKISCSVYAKLYKKKMFNLVRFDTNISFSEDNELIFRIICNSDKIIQSNTVLYYYLQRNGSATKTKDVDKQIRNMKNICLVADRQKELLYIHDETKILTNFYITYIWQLTKGIVELNTNSKNLDTQFRERLNEYYCELDKSIANIGVEMRIKVFMYRYMKSFLRLVKKKW
mgnify:CR=1 FL=1